MKIIADLQLHSKYSRAVSKDMVVQEIARWARVKGIDLAATGDWTHPLWFRELRASLEEAGEGIYKIKNQILNIKNTNQNSKIKDEGSKEPHFLLSTEVSCIYSQGGKIRRIHILIFAPSFEVADRINQEFRRRGVNLLSDGRPIMGLTSRQVAELVLGVDERCLLIPAHCWTPWFSLYGSMSGFDSIEECFGDYSKYIYAIETGLSSDPAMNWRIGELENRQIVSFSDAHSGVKLGREATVFELPEVSYENIYKAIRQLGHSAFRKINPNSPKAEEPSSPSISYTIEFYPEEGKYHYTGHRDCGVRQTPGETRKLGTTCPVCGKKLTVGVMHRVEQLASREITNSKIQMTNDEHGVKWIKDEGGGRPPYVMMVPLTEILSEVLKSGVSSKKVVSEYEKLTTVLGSEFKILLQIKPEDIEKVSGTKIREAVMKVRGGDIFIDPGYDGVFGKVKIWPAPPAGGPEKEKDSPAEALAKEGKEQMGLF